MFPPSNIDITLALFHSSGTFPSFNELVIVSQIGSSRWSLHSFNAQPDTPSNLSNNLPIASLCTVISCNPWQCNVLLSSVKSSAVNTVLKLSFITSHISFSIWYVFPPLIIFSIISLFFIFIHIFFYSLFLFPTSFSKFLSSSLLILIYSFLSPLYCCLLLSFLCFMSFFHALSFAFIASMHLALYLACIFSQLYKKVHNFLLHYISVRI
ncbi:hypothetical protein E2C01_040156 [Portunus trituberculatus]|uniref:Uncharacterized protein n=1 Tax=Portunus trituberculatus TaxID=210409 RepID=A0A5B7FLT0_PORTR|nr:hypothetical protein [Portunus trituberculatus]